MVFIYLFFLLISPLAIYYLIKQRVKYSLLIIIVYDLLFLIYALNIYYFNINYWTRDLFPIAVSMVAMILNIAFCIKCVYHRKNQMLFLLIIPIVLIIIGINRIDKKVLL